MLIKTLRSYVCLTNIKDMNTTVPNAIGILFHFEEIWDARIVIIRTRKARRKLKKFVFHGASEPNGKK